MIIIEPGGMQVVAFLVMAFPNEKAGVQTCEAIKKAKSEKTYSFENAAIICQYYHGKVYYHETRGMKSGKDAGVGALIGCILCSPGEAVLGVSAGAVNGAAAAHTYAGFRDESLKTVGLAFALQFMAFHYPETQEKVPAWITAFRLVSSQGILLVFAWRNR